MGLSINSIKYFTVAILVTVVSIISTSGGVVNAAGETAVGICGSGYYVVGSYNLGSGGSSLSSLGTVIVAYNNTSKNNCVYTYKTAALTGTLHQVCTAVGTDSGSTVRFKQSDPTSLVNNANEPLNRWYGCTHYGISGSWDGLPLSANNKEWSNYTKYAGVRYIYAPGQCINISGGVDSRGDAKASNRGTTSLRRHAVHCG